MQDLEAALFATIKAGDPGKVETLLCQISDYQRKTIAENPGLSAKTEEDGDSALHLACRYGQAEIAEILIRYGASLEVTNNAGATPLALVPLDHTAIDFFSYLGSHGAFIGQHLPTLSEEIREIFADAKIQASLINLDTRIAGLPLSEALNVSYDETYAIACFQNLKICLAEAKKNGNQTMQANLTAQISHIEAHCRNALSRIDHIEQKREILKFYATITAVHHTLLKLISDHINLYPEFADTLPQHYSKIRHEVLKMIINVDEEALPLTEIGKLIPAYVNRLSEQMKKFAAKGKTHSFFKEAVESEEKLLQKSSTRKLLKEDKENLKQLRKQLQKLIDILEYYQNLPLLSEKTRSALVVSKKTIPVLCAALYLLILGILLYLDSYLSKDYKDSGHCTNANNTTTCSYNDSTFPLAISATIIYATLAPIPLLGAIWFLWKEIENRTADTKAKLAISELEAENLPALLKIFIDNLSKLEAALKEVNYKTALADELSDKIIKLKNPKRAIYSALGVLQSLDSLLALFILEIKRKQVPLRFSLFCPPSENPAVWADDDTLMLHIDSNSEDEEMGLILNRNAG